ncbi:RNA polymerase sigma factor SigJ [Rheinheimera pacifica]|uniref:RNA polymerase sigma factor SigJ n=1 Tax=Rheinheimera pacifica TaxID=173990 RepID=UPI002ED9313D
MADQRTEIFAQHRKTIEGLAYRMLGTLAEAHDAVQETYLKWHHADITAIERPRAWLITVCSRIALNQLQSARRQREMYSGEWLPEPFLDEFAMQPDDPAWQTELNNSMSFALLLALEKLSPLERAAFLLHDIFELSFAEIAQVLQKSAVQCRQWATRARKHIRQQGRRFVTTPEMHSALLEGFIAAAQQHDSDKLLTLLAQDVELYSDGGGKVQALAEVMRGAGEVAGFLAGIFSAYRQNGIEICFQPQRFNGSLGVLVFEDQQLATAFTIETHAGRIQHIYAVRNPDKLSGLH